MILLYTGLKKNTASKIVHIQRLSHVISFEVLFERHSDYVEINMYIVLKNFIKNKLLSCSYTVLDVRP